MDEWPDEKKRRVMDIIQDLGLPPKGDALDFGCGNGVLTEIIHQALPGWRVYGTDISITAVENAKARYKGCIFFQTDNPDYKEKKYDFLFTNHVLEHVYNLQETFDEIVNFLKNRSFMLHILPCGNRGSLEYRVCLLKTNGIDREMGNRFFYEVLGHLRRLTSKQLEGLAQEKSFLLKNAFYSNQFYGAIDWITDSDLKFVLKFTSKDHALNSIAILKLFGLRLLLVSILLIRISGKGIDKYFQEKRGLMSFLQFTIVIPYYMFSLMIHSWFKKKADEEWTLSKSDPRGSEMALFFHRDYGN